MIIKVAKLTLLAAIGLVVIFTLSSLLMAVWMFNRPLWQVLDLIIIPLVLAVGAYLLNQAQRKREEERSKRERETDRQIAQNRDEEAALQKYIDVMRELLIDKSLLDSEKDDPKRDVVKTLTLATLRRMKSGRRNEILLRFLMEAGVISKANEEEKIIQFRGEDLSGIVLELANLELANLELANLSGVNLSGAILSGANLSGANLEEANLEWANLEWANLRGAYLRGANLEEANLKGANLEGADPEEANLEGARYNKETLWPEGFDPEEAGAVKSD